MFIFSRTFDIAAGVLGTAIVVAGLTAVTSIGMNAELGQVALEQVVFEQDATDGLSSRSVLPTHVARR